MLSFSFRYLCFSCGRFARFFHNAKITFYIMYRKIPFNVSCFLTIMLQFKTTCAISLRLKLTMVLNLLKN